MHVWISHACNFMIAVYGIVLLVPLIKACCLSPRIPVLLKLGRRPCSVWRIGCELLFTAFVSITAWGLIVFAHGTEALGYVVFLTGLFVSHMYKLLQPLWLREDGMRVLTQYPGLRITQFLPWSAIQRHEWKDATTLIVNPGWNQVTCLIPEEHVDQVKSLMRQKLSVPS